MKNKLFTLVVLVIGYFATNAQQEDPPGFRWGNGFYYDLSEGEKILFNHEEVKLLKVTNHYNQVKIGKDTLWLKVARRSVPRETGNVRIFVADNRNVKALAGNEQVHGLLTKDALLCLSDPRKPLLDPGKYIFPVSFNDGYTWQAEEESYMFSLYNDDVTGRSRSYRSYPGTGFDLHEARGSEKHWLVAVEESRVVQVGTATHSGDIGKVSVLLQSKSQPDIYYHYDHLNSKTLKVKEGQDLVRGEVIGTVSDDPDWGHVQFTIVRSDGDPDIPDYPGNAVNGFPQLFSLYSPYSEFAGRSFSRGRITFGMPRWLSGNRKNTMAFEHFSGKGWKLGNWCTPDKVEWVATAGRGNARLRKVMYEGTPARCENPVDYFEYQINVQNGTYRIRAKVGDVYLPSWQKMEFNGLPAAVKSLEAGQTEWTGERIIEVRDGILTVRIYIDKENEFVAGLEEIVFQRAY